jgi:hypothetical protein
MKCPDDLHKGGTMIRKRFSRRASLRLIVGLPIAVLGISQLATAATYDLRDRQGVPIKTQLDMNDTINMVDNNGNSVIYAAGPAYSPKQTCGECHDYTQITKAYHFMQGALPGGEGMGVSDTWSSENQDGTVQKYLANAYGHLLSGGQFGAW